MSNIVTAKEDPFGRAVLVYGNWFQFGPAERIAFPDVRSRMMLWCRAGQGMVRACGERIEMAAGTVVLLPWRHRIEYTASARDPMLLAGLHVIPDHGDIEPTWDVAHDASQPLARNPHRRDIADLWPSPITTTLSDHPTLAHLAEFALSAYLRTPHDAQILRLAGRLLLAECHRVATGADAAEHAQLPTDVRRVAQFIADHAHRPISLDELVEFSGWSASTLSRIMQRYFHSTPRDFVERCRMERACHALRTSRRTVAQVAQSLGYADPFHFSKVFRKVQGLTPLQFRKRASRL